MKDRFSSLTCLVTLALMPAGLAAADRVIFAEDFNHFSAGPLAGQGSWVQWPSASYGPSVHEGIAGADGTPVAGPAVSGATGIIAAQKIVEGGFQLQQTDIVTIEFDLVRRGSAAGIWSDTASWSGRPRRAETWGRSTRPT